MKERKEIKAIYPGSFDPITYGHINIIKRSADIFHKTIVAVLKNPGKTPLFSVEERVKLIKEYFDNDPRIEVDSFDGLLVNYAKKVNAKVIVRGLRVVSDFEYEFQMANMNRQLHPGMDTVFMMTEGKHFYVSSQLVKEVAILGGDVSSIVPPNVVEALKKKFKEGH